MSKLHSIVQCVAMLTLAASLSACAMFSGRETVGQYVDDTTITTKVKADILGDASLKVLQINVETMQGVVQLSGFVDSAKSKEKAENIARYVNGVKSVKDNLVIR